MLTFADPGLLWLVPLVPLLAWRWYRRPAPAVRYSDLTLVEDLPKRRATVARWAATVGRFGGLALLVIAAAGPRTPDLKTRLPAEGIAVALVVDASGSMAAPDFPSAAGGPLTTRLDAAKQALRLFVAGGETTDGSRFDGRPGDQFALVTFAAWPQTECPLTLNHSVLLKVLDDIQPRSGADAGTNVGDALAEALNRLLRPAGNRRKVVVLLSDGEHNTAGDAADAPLTPRQAAQLAANLRVPIYAVDCGGEPSGDADAARQRADGKAVLEAVARLTDGKAFAADSAADLRAVFAEIDALERSPADSFQYRRYHEHAAHCGLAAGVLFGLMTLLEATRWRRTP